MRSSILFVPRPKTRVLYRFYSSSNPHADFGKFSAMVEGKTLNLKIENPLKKNALSLNILNGLNEVLSMINANKIKFDRVSISFSDSCNVCCSGYDLDAFNLEEISQGKDFMPRSHPASLFIDNMYHLSKMMPTELIVDRPLLGFGIVLGGVCTKIKWSNIEKIKLFLPHLRIGIAFPLLPMLGVIHKFGADLTLELLVANYAITGEYFIKKMADADKLSQEQKISSMYRALETFSEIKQGKSVVINDREWRLKNRTGKLSELIDLHVRQFEIYNQYGMEIEKIPEMVQLEIDERRISTVCKPLAESIHRHRTALSEMNPKIYDDTYKPNVKN